MLNCPIRLVLDSTGFLFLSALTCLLWLVRKEVNPIQLVSSFYHPLLICHKVTVGHGMVTAFFLVTSYTFNPLIITALYYRGDKGSSLVGPPLWREALSSWRKDVHFSSLVCRHSSSEIFGVISVDLNAKNTQILMFSPGHKFDIWRIYRRSSDAYFTLWN